MAHEDTLHIGFLAFPGVQQLDLTAPYEILAISPSTQCHIVAATLDPVQSATGLTLTPTKTYDDCPRLDVICVPGGNGINPLLVGPAATPAHAFLKRQAEHAKYITAVCTGSLVLGAAGLLKGVHATTHWASVDLLAPFGAIPVYDERVVVDGRFMTGGGVTSGIDFALMLVEKLRGQRASEVAQLFIEYDPQPPHDVGHPRKAQAEVLDLVRARIAGSRREREAKTAEATGQSDVPKAAWAHSQ